MKAKIAKYKEAEYYFHIGEWNALHRSRRSEHASVCNRCGKRRVLYGLRGRSLCLSCWFEQAHEGHNLTTNEKGVRLCNVCHLGKRTKIR